MPFVSYRKIYRDAVCYIITVLQKKLTTVRNPDDNPFHRIRNHNCDKNNRDSHRHVSATTQLPITLLFSDDFVQKERSDELFK